MTTVEEESIADVREKRHAVVLASLNDIGPQTAAQLGAALEMSTAVVIGVLGRLRTAGQVRRDSYGVWKPGEDPERDQPLPRGRPSGHSGAAERDARVLELLEENPGGLTRNAIAEALDESVSKVWLALDRLRKAELARTCAPVPVTEEVGGQVKRRGSQVLWAAGAQCPE